MRHFARLAAICTLAAALLAAFPDATSAHEDREIADGTYSITIGFINEPAYLNQQNGLYLEVRSTAEPAEAATPHADEAGEADHHGDGAGITGLETTLQAEVIYGDQRMPLPLTPTEEPGVYESVFFPTAVGDYSFRLVGQIEGIAIDETFTSSPNGFDSVQDIAPLQFPK